MKSSNFDTLEAFEALLDGWRTEAENVGVNLRVVAVNFPPGLNGIMDSAQFSYDDSGIESNTPYWDITG